MFYVIFKLTQCLDFFDIMESYFRNCVLLFLFGSSVWIFLVYDFLCLLSGKGLWRSRFWRIQPMWIFQHCHV